MSTSEATTEIVVRKPQTNGHVTLKALNRAARELNLISVSAKRLNSFATIGQFLTEIGIIKYGNGRLLGSAALLQESAFKCAEMAARDDIAADVRRLYLDLQLRFIKALDQNIALQLEVNKAAEQADKAGMMSSAKPFLPGAQVSPIQINIGSGVTVTEKKVEESCKT